MVGQKLIDVNEGGPEYVSTDNVDGSADDTALATKTLMIG